MAKSVIIRIVSALLTMILAMSFCACQSSPSSEVSEASISSDEENISSPEEIDELPRVEYTSSKPNLTPVPEYFTDIPYIGLYNADSLKTYYTESADSRIYPASLTKMVTASVALKYASSVDTVYPVGTEMSLVQPHSSLCGIRRGMALSLEQLLYGLLLPSGNDAAYTIAVNVAREASGNNNMSDVEAVDYFCGLMNEYCAEIGAVNSHFVTPEGWDNSEQYTTVNDLAIICAYAMKNEVIAEIVKTPEIRFLAQSGETFVLANSNRFLHEDSEFYNEAVIGTKTGFTDLAGACLVATVEIEGRRYIAIAAGCPDDISRFTTVAELIEFAYRYHGADFIYEYYERTEK